MAPIDANAVGYAIANPR